MKKLVESSKKVFAKMGEKIKINKIAPVGNKNNSTTNKKTKKKINSALPLKSFIASLIVMIFLVELVFGISVYALRFKDDVTTAMAKIIPYPAIFTASGVVTISEYWMEKEYIEHYYKSTKQNDYNLEELSSQILKQEAENKILQKEAIAYKISVSGKETDEAMNQIFTENGGEEEVSKALKDLYGLDVNQFKTLVKTQLLRDKITKEVIAHVEARHILITVDKDATQEKVDEAKARIDKYAEEIKNGLSFEEAANKYSEDVGSNKDGGKLETFARGDMVKEFEDVAFSTKKGEVSQPFRSSFGWHIVKVEDSSGYVQMSFDDWVNDLMSKSYVTYLYKE